MSENLGCFTNGVSYMYRHGIHAYRRAPLSGSKVGLVAEQVTAPLLRSTSRPCSFGCYLFGEVAS